MDLVTGTYRTLTKRCISLETCKKFNYQQGTHNGKPVQIANYYRGNDIVGQKLKTPDKQFSWIGESKQAELFGQQLWRTGGKRIVITEGEIDCMSVSQVFNNKWPVVSIQNGAPSAVKSLKAQLEYLESYDEIVIAFDSDEPGQKAATECAILFTPGKVKIANWSPYKDANAMLQDGKSKEIAAVIFEAKLYRPDGILAGSEMPLEALLRGEDEFAYQIPYPKLNAMLNGLRKAEITTLTAGSGIGKSTFAKELVAYLMTQHGLKIGLVALEESIKKSALGMMAINLSIPLGQLYLDRTLAGEERFTQAYYEMVANNRLYLYDHFGSLDSDHLLNKLKYLAVGCNVDFIMLDHISIVVSGIESGEERRIIDNLMTNLRSLVEKSGVGMILISHLKVPDKTPHEEGGRVTMNQLRGSGSIKQLSDNIVGLERNQQADDPDKSYVRLLKNRLFGVTGLADTLVYDRVTGRLLPAYQEGDEFLEESKGTEVIWDNTAFKDEPTSTGTTEDDECPF